MTKEPFDDAQGQVESSTQGISETEEAKLRQADLQEKTNPPKDAEGEKVPERERGEDEPAAEDDQV